MKVLFVDDDPRELAEVKRLVQEGHITLAGRFCAGAEARGALGQQDWNVIVAGLHSPVDGAADVLRQVEVEQPDLARMVLADSLDLREQVPAHVYLRRPLAADTLRRALHAAPRWKDRMGSTSLIDIITGAAKLPTLPDVFIEIQQELACGDPSMKRVGEIVRRDAAMSLKVLKMVNSSLFGLRSEVGDVGQAAALLGLTTVSALVLAAGVFTVGSAIERQFIGQLWRESLQVGTIARRMAQTYGLARSDVEEAQIAGLLHDVGEIVLFRNWPEKFAEIDMKDREASEQEAFGAGHADIGAFLGALWELAPGVVEAIGHHHHPSRSKWPSVASPVTAVHVARALVDSKGDLERAPFDLEHFGALGWDRVEDWFLEASAPLSA